MCVFVSRPKKNATFLRKTLTPPKRLLIFLGKETHSETKSWKSSMILTKKSYNNNGKLWKLSRSLRVNQNFFIFLSFFIISPFFRFFFVIFHFFIFFFIFHFFIFCHVLSFDFYLFFFLFFFFLFLFFLFVGGSNSDFFVGLNFVTISLHTFYQKNSFFRHVSGCTPLMPLFLFFSSLFFPFVFLLFFFLFLSLGSCSSKRFSLFFVFWHQYQSLTVSSVVGAPWRCGVLTT